MILAKRLEQLGLSDKEARVYGSLLEMGEASPQNLALKSGINRATTYVILESLVNKGLVTTFLKKKKASFAIQSPLQILDLLYNEKKLVDEKIGLAKKLMPELEVLERLTSERAKVRFFEGQAGIEIIRRSISRKNLRVIKNIYHINEVFSRHPYAPGDHRHTYLKNIKQMQSIVVFDTKVPIPKYPVFKNEERRYLPADKFPFYAELILLVDRAVLISYRENLMALVIENKAFVEALTTLFDLSWLGSQNYHSIKGLIKA